MTIASSGPLAGRYNLKRERLVLPAGTIWQADDTAADGHALVFMLNEGLPDANEVVREALAAAKDTTDPRLIGWVDGGVLDNGSAWLAAPLMGEATFSEHVERTSGLSATEAISLARQVGQAIAPLHANGDSHGFLCGEFVRLTMAAEGSFSVHVYGHGLSNLLPSYDALNRDAVFGGHPEYMAPERCRGESAHLSCDIYSVGCLMYEAIRGKTPFAPRSSRSGFSTTMKRHQVENPIALHMRFGSMAHIQAYEAIALKALSKTDANRQAGVGELNQSMDALIAEAGVVVPGPALGAPGEQASAEASAAATDETKSDTEAPEASADDAANTSGAGGTLMAAGLAPEVKALADAAERKRAQEAETIDLDESEARNAKKGRRGSLKTTQMDIQNLDKPQGEVDEWFVDKPEQLRGGAHEEPANPFDDTQKSPVFWIVAGVIAALAAGTVYLAVGDPSKKNASAADSKARENRVLTAQEAQESKRLADLKRREEARLAEEREAEKRAREREMLAFMATGDLETVRAVAEARAGNEAEKPANNANVGESTTKTEKAEDTPVPAEPTTPSPDKAESPDGQPEAPVGNAEGSDKRDKAEAAVEAEEAKKAAKAAEEAEATKAAEAQKQADAAKAAKEAEAKKAAEEAKAREAAKAQEEAEAKRIAEAEKAEEAANAKKEARAKARKEARAKRKAEKAEKARKRAEAKEKAKAETKAAETKKKEAKPAKAASNEDPKETSKRLTKLGVSAYKKGNYKKAASLFKRAVNFDKSNVFAQKLLAKTKNKL